MKHRDDREQEIMRDMFNVLYDFKRVVVMSNDYAADLEKALYDKDDPTECDFDESHEMTDEQVEFRKLYHIMRATIERMRERRERLAYAKIAAMREELGNGHR